MNRSSENIFAAIKFVLFFFSCPKHLNKGPCWSVALLYGVLILGLGRGLSCTGTTAQAGRPEFGFPAPVVKVRRCDNACLKSQHRGSRDRRIPGTHLPAGLVKLHLLASLRDPASKYKIESGFETLTFIPHSCMCAHVCSPPPTRTHNMYIHIHTHTGVKSLSPSCCL